MTPCVTCRSPSCTKEYPEHADLGQGVTHHGTPDECGCIEKAHRVRSPREAFVLRATCDHANTGVGGFRVHLTDEHWDSIVRGFEKLQAESLDAKRSEDELADRVQDYQDLGAKYADLADRHDQAVSVLRILTDVGTSMRMRVRKNHLLAEDSLCEGWCAVCQTILLWDANVKAATDLLASEKKKP